MGNESYTGNFMSQPLDQWAMENLARQLYEQGDPKGVFGDAYTRWKAEQDAGAANYQWVSGMDEATQSYQPTPFTEYTPEQIAAYLDPYAPPILSGDPWLDRFAQNWDKATANNDPYVPQVVSSPGGVPVVQWSSYKDPSGFFDKASDFVGGALPFSGFALAGLGSSAIGGALTADALAAEIAGLTGSGVATGGAIGTGAVAGGGILADVINSVPNPFGGSGSDLIGGAAGDTLGSGIDWTAIDQSIADLGTAAGEAENLGTAGSIASGGSAGLGGLNLPSTPSMPPADPSGTTTTTETGTPNWDPSAPPAGASATLLDRILNGTATAGDWASILGTVGSTALGVYGSNQQADALRDIAEQARNDRLPFLNQATNWFNNPASYYAGAPAQEAMKGTLAGLSATYGNPIGSGTAMALANEAGLRNWQNAYTGAANIGLGGQDSRNSLLASGASADRGVTASLASGLGSLTQPDNSLESLIRRYGNQFSSFLT